MHTHTQKLHNKIQTFDKIVLFTYKLFHSLQIKQTRRKPKRGPERLIIPHTDPKNRKSHAAPNRGFAAGHTAQVSKVKDH